MSDFPPLWYFPGLFLNQLVWFALVDYLVPCRQPELWAVAYSNYTKVGAGPLEEFRLEKWKVEKLWLQIVAAGKYNTSFGLVFGLLWSESLREAVK